MNEEFMKDLQNASIDLSSSIYLEGGCGDIITFKYDSASKNYQLYYTEDGEDEKFMTELNAQELKELKNACESLLRHTTNTNDNA